MQPTRLTRAQVGIVLAHLALALLYGAMTPPWEAHDETGHFAYVNHLVATASLPDVRAERQVLFDQMHQPPLYYVLTAALTFWVDRSDNIQPIPNPFAFDGTNRRGVRLMLRQANEDFPWRGTVLALHAARVVSALLTTATILLLASTSNALFGRGSAASLLSTALGAFNPQVLFMGGMVNNDAMAAFAGALAAHVGVRLLDTPASARIAGLLGAAAGLGALSKNNALALLPFALLTAVLATCYQRAPLRTLLRQIGLVGIGFALVAGSLFAYNALRYGRMLLDRDPANPLLTAPTSVIGEGIVVSLRDAWLPQLFLNTLNTFWGKFGWGNVGFPDALYFGFGLLTLLGIAGCILGAWYGQPALRMRLAFLSLLGLSMMALPLYRALFFQDPGLMPGRYLMPALTGYVGLLGFGLGFFLERVSIKRPGLRGRVLLAARFALAGVALGAPAAFIWPRYSPQFVADQRAAPLLTFGDLVEVTGVSAHTALLPDREGMRHYARVQVSWRPLRAAPERFAFGVSVLGRESEVLGTLVRYPAGGNYPTAVWRPGLAFVETYDVLIEKPCAQLPAQGRVSLAVFEVDSGADGLQTRPLRFLPAFDGQGREASPIVGRFRIGVPPPMAVFWQPPLADFDGVWLREATLELLPNRQLVARLTYELVRQNGKPATAFVHVLQGDGSLVVQADHPLQGGHYPTDLWLPGECARETFTLDLPPGVAGELRVVTGLYDPGGARFRANLPEDVFLVGAISVQAVSSDK